MSKHDPLSHGWMKEIPLQPVTEDMDFSPGMVVVVEEDGKVIYLICKDAIHNYDSDLVTFGCRCCAWQIIPTHYGWLRDHPDFGGQY